MMKGTRRRIKVKNFSEFWPFYLREHNHPTNRNMHFTGTLLAIITLSWGISTLDWRCFLIAPLIGYGFAWVGHFVFQKNKPATFKYPVWSLFGDFKMFGLMASGRINEELEQSKAGQAAAKSQRKNL
jgi:hypothetical protein